MLVSIVIRTLNEAKHLGNLLSGIAAQEANGINVEVVLVDSGSTDNTLEIARRHNCKILNIARQEFSFGRSLNIGCEEASGEILVLISGHCVPQNHQWLKLLCLPLMQNQADYCYGKQIGGPSNRYSESRIFAKYYPEESKIPQSGFYCNNANSALTRSVWERYRFDEDLTGLEDMELARRLVNDGKQIAYIAEACVYHHHEEKWRNVKRRFEREAIALQRIMPQIHIHKWDLVRYICSSIWLDLSSAWQQGLLPEKALEIVQYRFFQYWGSYLGNHDHRKLSHAQKEEYFYPEEFRSKHEA